ncbi:MAG: hypothetical protein ACFCD0_14475 [Gemmataceae bacterium]
MDALTYGNGDVILGDNPGDDENGMEPDEYKEDMNDENPGEDDSESEDGDYSDDVLGEGDSDHDSDSSDREPERSEFRRQLIRFFQRWFSRQ